MTKKYSVHLFRVVYEGITIHDVETDSPEQARRFVERFQAHEDDDKWHREPTKARATEVREQKEEHYDKGKSH